MQYVTLDRVGKPFLDSNYLGFAVRMISVASTQLCSFSVTTTTINEWV